LDFLIAIFILCLLLLVYVYAGYPLVARFLGGMNPRRVEAAERGTFQPTVTVLIAAFNEAK
jgi:hypothetical protein